MRYGTVQLRYSTVQYGIDHDKIRITKSCRQPRIELESRRDKKRCVGERDKGRDNEKRVGKLIGYSQASGQHGEQVRVVSDRTESCLLLATVYRCHRSILAHGSSTLSLSLQRRRHQFNPPSAVHKKANV